MRCKRTCTCGRHDGRGKERSRTRVATTRHTIRGLYWAAGFLEGEGTFLRQGNNGEAVRATQVQREPLRRLLRILGGSIDRGGKPQEQAHNQSYVWYACGARARGIMMTLYTLMSPKRKRQIRKALRA